FALDGPGGPRCTDGVVNRLQLDVSMVLELIEQLGMPALETMPVADARALFAGMATGRPPGPDVGEVVDGVLPGPAGPLAYRRYRPAGAGPPPRAGGFPRGGAGGRGPARAATLLRAPPARCPA